MKKLRDNVEVLVDLELASANEKFPKFASQHEGYAVILEEIDEVEDELKFCNELIDDMWNKIRKNLDCKDDAKILHKYAVSLACEAIQVAAMADKFINSQPGGKENGK